MKIIIFVILVLLSVKTTQQKFVIPDVKIEVLSPGLRVSLPDSAGIQLFAFHANINQPIKGKADGSISKEVRSADNGQWTFSDSSINLKPGDVLNYWIFVQHNRLGFDKQDQKFTVPGTTEGPTTSAPVTCTGTATRINGGNTICGNTLIFEDDFSSPNIDETKWIIEQFIPYSPDYEFVSYEKNAKNGFIVSGQLNLKCTLRDDPNLIFLDLTNGCTGQRCTIQAVAGQIPPPIIAGRVRSKFSFQYGKIEVRAQLPRGDWIFPEIYLDPKSNEYGEGYNSGRVWIAYARGNQDLKTESNDQIGNNILYSGPVLHSREPGRSSATRDIPGNAWGSGFHIYTMTWKPDGFTYAVDGNEQFTIRPPNGAFSTLRDKIPHASYWTTSMAPFDKEFVLTLGIGAGGRSDFPDKCSSSGTMKPWKNTNPAAIMNMLKGKDQWLPSWSGDNSALKIDYVRVWSL